MKFHISYAISVGETRWELRVLTDEADGEKALEDFARIVILISKEILAQSREKEAAVEKKIEE